ncbi:hypothetical protein [Haloarchaeobius litoreus]|uniref:PCNA n=1 Tax=Haloarchaeobius litoreus TaxID=755306 RepID=A0ABD6DJP5_9EURY|nr:hypothetical protein [Haloarchaeobius litoreus]
MDAQPLAELAAPAAVFERMLSLAAVEPPGSDEPYYDEMLLQIDESSLRTPAGSVDAPLSAYCTAEADLLDAVDGVEGGPVTAVFDIVELRDWMAWVDDGGEGVSVRVDGDPETSEASALVVRSGAATARVDCVRDSGLLADVPRELPGRFTADERFRLADGTPAPTVVETDADQLRRIASGVRTAGTATFPFVVADGALRFELEEGGRARASAELAGEVSGPDVHNEYGGALGRVADVLTGPVTLQTGPDAPLAVVSRHSGFTLRYVLSRVES